MSDGASGDDRGPVEERLLELLTVLRAESPPIDESVIAAVMRTARWQYTVRGVLQITGLVAAAVGDGIAMLFGSAATGRDEEGRR